MVTGDSSSDLKVYVSTGDGLHPVQNKADIVHNTADPHNNNKEKVGLVHFREYPYS